jgi:hypothetical protein
VIRVLKNEFPGFLWSIQRHSGRQTYFQPITFFLKVIFLKYIYTRPLSKNKGLK